MSESAFTVDPGREVLAVTGPDAATYLQGQLSQDVLGLADGGFAWSWLLAPNGKVDALVRVTRLSAEDWLLDTDAGWGERVLTRLNRFKLRTKVDVVTSPRAVLGLRGTGWEEAVGRVAPTGVVLSPPWPGVQGADVVVPDRAGVDAAQVPAEDYEALRIVAGIPRMGAELDERTIPAETGLVAMTVSFTKGCYTGQELVARIDSRGGNVPRHLRGLRWGGPGPGPAAPLVEVGAELVGGDGRPAGTVTSVAPAPPSSPATGEGLVGEPGATAGETGGERSGWVGLGYVRRGFEVGEVLKAGPGGVEVTQVELPR